MFDIGFVEMLVIGLILLLVVGPERLPEVARTVGGWVHQAKQYFDSMKDQLDRETRFSELQSQVKSEADNLRKTGAEMGKAASPGKGAGADGDSAGEGEAAGGGETADAAAGTADADSAPDVSGRSAEEGAAAEDLERELDEEDEPKREDSGRG